MEEVHLEVLAEKKYSYDYENMDGVDYTRYHQSVNKLLAKSVCF